MIVALLGPKGAGKSTVANLLVERGARRYAFADPLKDLVQRAFDLTDAQVRGSQEDKEQIDPRYGVSTRDLLQRIGKAARDTFGEDFWIERCLDQIYQDGVEFAVIDDCRYPNEAQAVLDVGGQVWRLPLRAASNDGHESEIGYLSAPATLEVPAVDGLESLRLEVDRLFDEHVVPGLRRAEMRDSVEAMLDRGPVLVTFHATARGVVLPDHLRSGAQTLRFGHFLKPEIPDLLLDEDGISGTLTFSGKHHHCQIPWAAVLIAREENVVNPEKPKRGKHLRLVD